MTKFFTLFISLLALNAMAEETTSTPRIDERQQNQEQRIQEGAQSGSLTEVEAKRLEKRQDQIQKMENKAMADGQVSGKEARRIEHRQNQASKQIYKAKHNRRHK